MQVWEDVIFKFFWWKISSPTPPPPKKSQHAPLWAEADGLIRLSYEGNQNQLSASGRLGEFDCFIFFSFTGHRESRLLGGWDLETKKNNKSGKCSKAMLPHALFKLGNSSETNNRGSCKSIHVILVRRLSPTQIAGSLEARVTCHFLSCHTTHSYCAQIRQ